MFKPFDTALHMSQPHLQALLFCHQPETGNFLVFYVVIDCMLFCVISAPSVTLLPMTPASPHVVETSLNSTFDDGLCVTVDVGLLFFLHDVVQTYIRENETSTTGK